MEEINELPPGIHVGRKLWASKFKDGWLTRLRFVMLPYTNIRNQKGAYGFRATIGFYNDMYPAAQLEYVRSHIHQWSRVCHLAGMEFERNAPGKIKGKHNLKLLFPFELGQRVKNVFARETPNQARTRSIFDWHDDTAAIKAGRRHMETFLRLIDRFE